MADFAPLPSLLPKGCFFVFARELFALLDAPFAPSEADGERFSEYTQDAAPSHSSREGCRWKDGARVVELTHHEEHASETRERLEGRIVGLPGGCVLELHSGGAGVSALAEARVIVSSEDARAPSAEARARVSSAIGEALGLALVLASHRELGGARGAS